MGQLTPPDTTSRLTTASALTEGLRERRSRNGTLHTASFLRQALESFIDHHPLAPRYIFDAGKRNCLYWSRSARANKSKALSKAQHSDAAAQIYTKALAEIDDGFSSNILIISALVLCRESNEAAKIAERAIARFGYIGENGLFALAYALLLRKAGKYRMAVAQYTAAAQQANGVVRCSALASGAITGFHTNSVDIGAAFARQLDDEPEAISSRSIQASLATYQARNGGTDRLKRFERATELVGNYSLSVGTPL